MSESRTRRLAKPMLAGAALIWGSSFFMMKDIADVIPPPGALVQMACLTVMCTTAALLFQSVGQVWSWASPSSSWRWSARRPSSRFSGGNG